MIKKDFPILSRKVHGKPFDKTPSSAKSSAGRQGKPLIYLDNAATTQKPKQIIEAIADYYEKHNANVHRGIHVLSEEATQLYEEARKQVSRFIGSQDPNELVFVRNTTEAVNLVAYSWGREHIGESDEILISELEHHSNIVPWQMLAKEKGATVKYVRVTDDGKLDLRDLKSKISEKTKLVALVHVSNFLGTINPIQEISKIIKRSDLAHTRSDLKIRGSYPLFLVDGAQAVGHMPIDVKKLGCDFYAFSGHKMYGPMGIGCLWARKEILENMPPFLTGGGMISEVQTSGSTFAELPDKFDAGTPNVEGAVGLAAAVTYLQRIGMENVRLHELELTRYALNKLYKGSTFAGQRLNLKIFGPITAEERGGLIAFTVHLGDREIHGHDVAQVLDSEGVAVRSGHHCTMPLHTKLGLSATTRVSFGIYNTKEDVDRLMEALGKISEIFGGTA